MQTTHASQRQPIGDGKVSPQSSPHPDRSGDRLLQLPQVSEITTLSEATLRWLRHRGEGPPMFRLQRRLVCWERDLYAWIEAQASADAGRSA